MKEFEHGVLRSDELTEMGDGDLQKGIEKINDDRWEISERYFDQATGETYYSVEREKINL